MNSEYDKKQPIEFTVNNNDSINYFIYVSLEKFQFNKWITYEEDVFSLPMQTDFLTRILNKKDFAIFEFKLNNPNWLDNPNLTKRENKEIRKNLKVGKFRLKIYYNKFEGCFTDYLYSEEFFIK